LAFNRALLKSLAATSAQARHTLGAALDEEMRALALDDAVTAAAVHRIVGEARAELGAAMGARDWLTRDIEQATTGCTSDLSPDEESDQHEGRQLRSCA
jgi:hypothetical protein